MKIIKHLDVFTLNDLFSVRMVKSVYVPSFLICQKFSACLEVNVSVRGNGSASAAAMSEVKTGKISAFPFLYCHLPCCSQPLYMGRESLFVCVI